MEDKGKETGNKYKRVSTKDIFRKKLVFAPNSTCSMAPRDITSNRMKPSLKGHVKPASYGLTKSTKIVAKEKTSYFPVKTVYYFSWKIFPQLRVGCVPRQKCGHYLADCPTDSAIGFSTWSNRVKDGFAGRVRLISKHLSKLSYSSDTSAVT